MAGESPPILLRGKPMNYPLWQLFKDGLQACRDGKTRESFQSPNQTTTRYAQEKERYVWQIGWDTEERFTKKQKKDLGGA